MTTLPTIRRIVPPPGTGFNVRHKTARSEVVLIPYMWIPMLGASLDLCNLCHVVHPVKTSHLEVDDNGRATVSYGVLQNMRRAGLKQFGLTFEGSLAAPPPLRLDGKTSRAEVDWNNRSSVVNNSKGILHKALRGTGARNG